MLRISSNIILFSTTILQTGSWGQNQNHTARELTTESKSHFQLPSNIPVLVLTTHFPAHTVQVGEGKRVSRQSTLRVSQRFTGQRLPC